MVSANSKSKAITIPAAYQPELLTPESPVAETSLIAADSPRTAYYRVSIYYLPGAGYRITKQSGAAGTKGCQEDYWRPSLNLALDKKEKLLAAKLRKKTGLRRYTIVTGHGTEIAEENICG